MPMQPRPIAPTLIPDCPSARVSMLDVSVSFDPVGSGGSRSARMQTLLNDLRYAARRLLRSPGFTVLAVLTVGLGVGATTVMFSAVNGVLLKPLSYPEPDRLVMIRGATRAQPGRPGVISYPDYRDWRQESRSFETMAALRPADVTVAGPGGPERIQGARGTASFFQTLRVVPAVGPLFPADVDPPRGEPVAVLRHRFCRGPLAAPSPLRPRTTP